MNEDDDGRRHADRRHDDGRRAGDRPRNIVVVEDDPMILSFLSMQAWGAGKVVASFATAEIAMQFGAWDQVDVLITDELLGKGMSGAALCAWVKSHHPHVKRIITSADPPVADVARVADRFIDKAELRSGLNAILAELRDGRR